MARRGWAPEPDWLGRGGGGATRPSFGGPTNKKGHNPSQHEMGCVRGGCCIKTLPAWLFGALIVLAAFAGGAVVFTRWLDIETARAFFLPARAPTCAGADCGPPDGAPMQSEPQQPSPMPIRSGATVLPIVLSNEGGPADEPAKVVDGGVRSDAGFVVPTIGPLVAARAAASGQTAASPPDASRTAVSTDDGGASARSERAEDAGQPRPGVRCGSATCPEGQVCCNASCSQCRPPGASCSQVLCGPISPMSASCGRNTCNVGEVCCNASCGICTQPGGTCSQQRCTDGVQVPVSVPCGPNTCNVGQVCCNASCGICANPGESCRREPCP